MPIENDPKAIVYEVGLIALIHQQTAIRAIDCLENGDTSGCTEILTHMIASIDTLLGNPPSN